MNHGPLIFLAVFFSLATSWLGMVFLPQLHIGRQDPVKIEATGELYPSARPGLASQGREVYRANGCVACHSQQVRSSKADLAQWGKRRSVAQDYLYDNPVLLGAQRIGPDLTNLGARLKSEHFQLVHLYDPRALMDGSIMPPYPFLFEKRRLGRQPSPDALKRIGRFTPEKGYEIVPKPEAKALVAYLASLRAETTLFETPMPAPGTNAAPTNAVVSTSTNAPTNAAPSSTTNVPPK